MSLRVTGYTPEGKRIVIDEGPSGIAWGGHIRGGPIVGEAGEWEKAREKERLRKTTEAQRRELAIARLRPRGERLLEKIERETARFLQEQAELG